MVTAVVSAKGHIVLPVAVRKALGLTLGMRVHIRIEGKSAVISPCFDEKPATTIAEIQHLLRYSGRRVATKALRVTNYKD